MDVSVATCPICLGNYGGTCRRLPINGDSQKFSCDACGTFKISRTVMDDFCDADLLRGTPIERAYISFLIANAQSKEIQPFILSEWLRNALDNVRLPLPPDQGRRLIEIIGDGTSQSGTTLEQFEPWVYSRVGVVDRGRLNRVFEELMSRGLVTGNEVPDSYDEAGHYLDIELTFSGWDVFEALKSGHSPGKFGFLAMQYGDPRLEKFAKLVIKPTVSERLSFDLIDLRDVAQAGIIDNLMRQQIRDSAFVLVDLTHDNSGAYWEAGYAEGLGKPVIYLCEASKFELAKTHFDTNHCTTVLWKLNEPDNFKDELVATLRRSLGLFPNSR